MGKREREMYGQYVNDNERLKLLLDEKCKHKRMRRQGGTRTPCGAAQRGLAGEAGQGGKKVFDVFCEILCSRLLTYSNATH